MLVASMAAEAVVNGNGFIVWLIVQSIPESDISDYIRERPGRVSSELALYEFEFAMTFSAHFYYPT